LGLEIIRFRVDNDRTSNDRTLVICKRYVMIKIFQLRRSRCIRLDVAHIANMARIYIRPGVPLVCRIEVSPR
jgi:hypothetical protein